MTDAARAHPAALIVEDDGDVAEFYATALRLAGFAPEIAHDGRAALARLAATQPALVVLDLQLPFVSGHELLRRIRADARLAGTRVVVTTGQARAATAVEADADLVLVKPVSASQLSDLAARLRQTLQG